MRTVRALPSAFAAAACAHAAVASALFLLPRRGALVLPAPPLPAELFFVGEEMPRVSPLPRNESAPVPTAVARATAPRGFASAGSSPESASSAIVATADVGPAEPAPAASARSDANPGALIDLGIGSLWKSVALASGPPARELSSGDRTMRDALDAHDHDLGLGPGGPLVAAAHEAGSIAIAPGTGSATFDVESDETGRVTMANVVSVSADAAGWAAVAQQLVSLMASKRLHLPPGARGLHTRLRITAEQTLPSGEKGTTHLGAVPDDVAGGGGSVCVGVGWLRKCEKGMPVGVTRNAADVANFGANVARVVRAQILGEQTL